MADIITLTNKEFYKDLKTYAYEISGEESITKSFPYFCLKIFFNMSNDDIENAIYGLGSNDESIDAFWVDEENKEIYIVQFKSAESSSKFEICAPKNWFSFLSELPTNKKLLNENFVNIHKNKRIREEIAPEFVSYYKQDFKVNLCLFCLCKASEESILSHPNITFYGANEIKNQWIEYQSGISQTNPKECELNIDFSDDANDAHIIKFRAKDNNTNKKTYVVILTGEELVKLRIKHRHQLFDKNVRTFLGKNKINNKIIECALNTPGIFYCFNNGISITCNRCKETIENTKLILEQPQIINGAQTVNSLYEAYNRLYLQNKSKFGSKELAEENTIKHFNQIRVLCRIIENNDSEFARNLTISANSQNDVKIYDFYANEPIQEELQRKFAEYSYFYERKRGERRYMESKGKPQNDFLGKNKDYFKYWDVNINIETIARTYQSFLGKPGLGEANPTNILQSKTQEDYRKIFGSKRSDVTDEKIKNMILAFNIWNSVKTQAKAYDNVVKTWNKLSEEQDSKILISELKKEVEKISFVGTKLIENILQCDNYENLIPFVKDRLIKYYFLISRGSNMLTALIKAIIDHNKYLNLIMDNGLYQNQEIIERLIVKKWIGILIKDAILPIYDDARNKERLSEETFYKRVGYFDKIKDRIIDMELLDDDKNLEEMFPLSLK